MSVPLREAIKLDEVSITDAVSLRIACLVLAHIPSDAPEEVVRRAQDYNAHLAPNQVAQIIAPSVLPIRAGWVSLMCLRLAHGHHFTRQEVTARAVIYELYALDGAAASACVEGAAS